jgi:hypothetical protein
VGQKVILSIRVLKQDSEPAQFDHPAGERSFDRVETFQQKNQVDQQLAALFHGNGYSLHGLLICRKLH